MKTWNEELIEKETERRLTQVRNNKKFMSGVTASLESYLNGEKALLFSELKRKYNKSSGLDG